MTIRDKPADSMFNMEAGKGRLRPLGPLASCYARSRDTDGAFPHLAGGSLSM